MQRLKLLGLVLAVMVFAGCQDEATPQDENITKCQTPKYQVLFDTSKISGSTDLFDMYDFKALLGKTLSASNCFVFTQEAGENVWNLDVQYTLEIHKKSEDSNIAKSTSEAVLTSLVNLTLAQKKQTIKERANGELKLSKNHYFGTGKESEISQSEIIKLLRQNLLFIIDDLVRQ